MSAERLREAAALMRERAENANEGPWYVERNVHDYHASVMAAPDGLAYAFALTTNLVPSDARHIASWHPEVALPVADLLDAEAALIESVERHRVFHPRLNRARVRLLLAIADAYLGGVS